MLNVYARLYYPFAGFGRRVNCETRRPWEGNNSTLWKGYFFMNYEVKLESFYRKLTASNLQED